MNAYSEARDADRRLAILQALAADQTYRMNDREIQRMLHLFGHHQDHGGVRTDIGWLSARGLVSVQQIETLQIVTLTERGLAAAGGYMAIDGVARPLLD